MGIHRCCMIENFSPQAILVKAMNSLNQFGVITYRPDLT